MERFDRAWVRLLLGLYPRRYRAERGDELEQSMRDVLRAARHAGEGAWSRRLWLLGDALATSLRVRWEGAGSALRGTYTERGDGMSTRIRTELRYAIRALRRSPGFTLTAVLTLGLGVGANTAIFGLVHEVLLEPLPYEGSGSLVQVQNRYLPGGSVGWVSGAEYWEYRTAREAFDGMTPVSPDVANLTGLPTALRLEGMRVGHEYFDLVGARAVLGRTFTQEETEPGAEPVVLVSHALWRNALSGDPDVLGQSLELDGRLHTVVGVMEPEHRPLSDFVFPGRAEVYWVPLTIDPATFDVQTVERHNLFVLGRLAEGTDPPAAERVMIDVVRRLERLYPGISNEGSRDVAVAPLASLVAGPVREPLLILSVAVALLLLVAAVNVANLTLARGDARASEIAVRAAMGASRGQLVWAALAESLVLGLAAGAAGLAIAVAGGGLFAHVLPSSLPLPEGPTLGLPVLGFTLLVAGLAGAVAGGLPAFRLARADVFGAVRSGGFSGPTGSSVTRRVLVVAQIAGAVVLVASASLLARSLHELRSVDPGFENEGLHLTSINASPASYPDAEAVRDLYVRLERQVEAIPGVETVTASWQTPLQTGMSDWPVMPAGPEGAEWVSADPNLVTPGYFNTYGIEIVEGRGFEPGDLQAPLGPVILNRQAATRLWGVESAVGRRVNLSFGEPEWREVIGVAEDIRGRGLRHEARVQTYMTLGQGPWARIPSLTLTVRGTLAGEELRRALQDVVRAIDPDIPLGPVVSFEAQVERSLERERLLSTLLATFAALALLLGTVGVYGLVSYSVARRTREIGLRMALGAGRPRVLELVVRQGAVLAVAGVALGVGGSLFTGRLLEGFLYGVSRTDASTLAVVSMVVLAVALLASFVPARRAARVPPTVALRSD